ncbi:putative 26S proteasome non-ATPase regulatory subunit 3 [Salvia divinorum]|uniref:26S proteasome non-ATPase regulatory subunit 3 n=1 Tax=Salvia divinorum TaxID=28513 RepID=A0ABD1GBU1_SALDI
MTQDVEMKDPANFVSSTLPSTPEQLKGITALIETGAYTHEIPRIVRALRWTIQIMKKLNVSELSAFLNSVFVPGWGLKCILGWHLIFLKRMNKIWKWI